MAKTGVMFRGARGKVAGFVYSKNPNGSGTIVREAVTPKNPRTLAQMQTRIAFGTVTQAASIMLPIIGQTFEKQDGEEKNRQRFIQLNNPILRSIAMQQANQGLTAMAGSFRGKNSTTLQPNPYRISEGSLVQPESIRVYVSDNNELTSMLLDEKAISLTPGQAYNPLNIWSNILGLSTKSQVTFVAISTADGEPVYYNSDPNANDDYIRGYGFTALRLIFKDNVEDFVAPDEAAGSDAVGAAMMAAIDSDKTSDAVISWLEMALTRYYDDGRLKVAVDDKFSELLKSYVEGIDGGYQPVAEGIFISQLVEGKWRYSSCTMACKDRSGQYGDESNNNWYGFVFDSALIDYIGAEATSTLYTRKGGDVNVI